MLYWQSLVNMQVENKVVEYGLTRTKSPPQSQVNTATNIMYLLSECPPHVISCLDIISAEPVYLLSFFTGSFILFNKAQTYNNPTVGRESLRWHFKEAVTVSQAVVNSK